MLFAFLALFLGAGQAVCASMMPPVSGAGIVANAHHGAVPERHDAAHDHHRQSDNHHSTQDAPHNNDCGYCAAAHGYKALAKSEQSASVDLSPTAKAVVKDALSPDWRTGYAQKYRMAPLWRGQRAQTPITLKTRLLI